LFTNPRPEAADLGRYYKSEEYISHSNSRRGIINKVYHRIRKRNHKTKFSIIEREVNTGRILDIGCATGEFLAFMKERGWTCQGVEPDPEARAFAAENYGLEVLEEDALNQFPEKSFEVITLWHVLEHVPRLQERMKQLKRLLKPGGLLVIAVPNAASYDAQKYGSYWAGFDVPRHLYHFSKESAVSLFEKQGFMCKEILPMKFDAYYVSLLSEKYRKSSLKILKAFFSGWRSNCYARRHQNGHSSLIYLLKMAKTEN
jgi:2-polyprenyl-3-methyl-5-hydroxy-6-metoxy-1,4-benzoquinol methylase